MPKFRFKFYWKSIELHWDIREYPAFYKLQGEYWTHWEWTWQLCEPNYEYIWYDGPHHIYSMIFGTLYNGHMYDHD